MERLGYDFYHRHALEVAPDLVGKVLVYQGQRLRISETEAYCGVSDTACHASKGRTNRTEVLYADAGTIYVYLCYGIHWLMNIITGDREDPQGVLIRAIASKTLRQNGMGDMAKEMCEKITNSGSYHEALSVIGEYVNITSAGEKQEADDDFDEDMKLN